METLMESLYLGFVVIDTPNLESSLACQQVCWWLSPGLKFSHKTITTFPEKRAEEVWRRQLCLANNWSAELCVGRLQQSMDYFIAVFLCHGVLLWAVSWKGCWVTVCSCSQLPGAEQQVQDITQACWGNHGLAHRHLTFKHSFLKYKSHLILSEVNDL